MSIRESVANNFASYIPGADCLFLKRLCSCSTSWGIDWVFVNITGIKILSYLLLSSSEFTGGQTKAERVNYQSIMT